MQYSTYNRLKEKAILHKACLLCGSTRTFLASAYSADSIVERWRNEYGIDVRQYFGGHVDVLSWKCRSCGLRFFDSCMGGDSELYTQLQHHEMYYLNEKWEFHMARRFIPLDARLLEVGCGTGSFLMGLSQGAKVQACGIEMNPEAVIAAQSKGLNVELADLTQIATARAGVYDVVCHFQVLEHVSNPCSFLRQCVDLLKPGGLLIVAVPNGGGFLKYEKAQLLNMPPHHLSIFHERTMRVVGHMLGLRVKRIIAEPLSDEHLKWFSDLQIDRIPRIPYVTWPFISPLRTSLPWVIKTLRLQRLIKGHNLFAVYQKI